MSLQTAADPLYGLIVPEIVLSNFASLVPPEHPRLALRINERASDHAQGSFEHRQYAAKNNFERRITRGENTSSLKARAPNA